MHNLYKKAQFKMNNVITLKVTEAFENDDWIRKVYNNMSTEGRKDLRNAFSVAKHSLNVFKKNCQNSTATILYHII